MIPRHTGRGWRSATIAQVALLLPFYWSVGRLASVGRTVRALAGSRVIRCSRGVVPGCGACSQGRGCCLACTAPVLAGRCGRGWLHGEGERLSVGGVMVPAASAGGWPDGPSWDSITGEQPADRACGIGMPEARPMSVACYPASSAWVVRTLTSAVLCSVGANAALCTDGDAVQSERKPTSLDVDGP